ncbi:hypothetical protein FRC04_012209 [Tulasnella sp. 424]|nr:hypothetical protein FRC04_012209 [Tulasnella sp. 424]
MANWFYGNYNAYGASTTMCENCHVRWKLAGHNYCSKTCATQATKQTLNAWQSSQEQSQTFYDRGCADPLRTEELALCENCGEKNKSSEIKQDGTVVEHPYCGILCYQESQNPIIPAAPTPPTKAPTPNSEDSDSVSLRAVDMKSEIGQKIRLMLEERWDSDEIALRKLKAIYRINLPGHVYRRFDFALQFNDFCPVITTYYGGIPTCNIANSADPVPCNSTDCHVCGALRSAFNNLFSKGDVYDNNLWAELNPATAHELAGTTSQQQQSNKKGVLIQCRVVTRMDLTELTHPYAGRICDDTFVSCSRPTAIIPTHLLICRAGAIAKQLSSTTTMAGGPRSPLTDLGRSKVTTDTRGQSRANPSESESSRDSSLPKVSDADPVASHAATLASAAQNSSAGAQGVQQGWAHWLQRYETPDTSGQRTWPNPVPNKQTTAGPSTALTSTVAPTPSTGLLLNPKRLESLLNASDLASVRTPKRRYSVVPPMNALRIPPYQSSLAATNARGASSLGWGGFVAPPPSASSSAYAQRGPRPAASNDASFPLPQSPDPVVLPASAGPGAPPPGASPFLNATPDIFSPAASSLARLSSPLSPGPVPGSTMARKMTKLRPYQSILFSSWYALLTEWV